MQNIYAGIICLLNMNLDLGTDFQVWSFLQQTNESRVNIRKQMKKTKDIVLLGVHGMLVVPNYWDVGTWGWLQRKKEFLFYEWTHLFLDLEHIMVIFIFESGRHHHQNEIWEKKEDIGIRKWRRWQSTCVEE